MGNILIVVESPAKAKTIAGMGGWPVGSPGEPTGRPRLVASMGHVRDLPHKSIGIDVQDGFRPHYVTAPGKQKTIHKLQEAAQGVQAVYLATDPDREGEAIAWHVLQVLRQALPKGTPVYRITFHEITATAVRLAFEHAGPLNLALVEAQQARRILDRLVGYYISPLLWKHVRGGRGLSAGRVQTVALRLVVDREREIQAFVPVEYWSIEAELQQQMRSPINPLGLTEPLKPTPFRAQLWRIADAQGQLQEPDLKNRADADAVVQALDQAMYWIDRVEQERKPRYPPPPFITSTLQQAASQVCGFPPKLTMQIAQQLYEGVPLNGQSGAVGLITYMRTDSPHVAPEAQTAAREAILKFWGQAYLPAAPPTYTARVKSAQEAHEAIRPTDPHRTPKQVKPDLDDRQYKLYELIWRRFIASQMKPALYDLTTAYIPTAPAAPPAPDARLHPNRLPFVFRAQGRVCAFDGFLKVYKELGEAGDAAEAETRLPPLTPGEWLELLRLIPEQHWTRPPSRYTESSLIKELERRGIGRPSTFASMVAIIQERDYVRRQLKFLVPTELGMAVCDMLVAAFANLFDYDFTARMEDQLDEIANGPVQTAQQQRLDMLARFWAELSPAVERAQADMPQVRIEPDKPQPTGQTCPQCGSELVRRRGKHGYFVGCTSYPQCKYIQKKTEKSAQPSGRACPLCSGELVLRRSKRGPFLGCSHYPTCKHTEPLDQKPA